VDRSHLEAGCSRQRHRRHEVRFQTNKVIIVMNCLKLVHFTK
jgi:hypothetical protein